MSTHRPFGVTHYEVPERLTKLSNIRPCDWHVCCALRQQHWPVVASRDFALGWG